MTALIVPEHAHAMVETLLAVDEFLAANERLCNWVRDEIGIGMAQSIDQSYLGDDLGFYLQNSMSFLAPGAEFLDEAVAGTQATVVFSVDGRLPAEQARLRLSGDTWRYDPQGGLSDGHIAAFHDMADGLDRLLIELQTNPSTAAEVRSSRERLMDEVESKLRRGVRMLSRARTESATARRGEGAP
jgi:hypothetical protein